MQPRICRGGCVVADVFSGENDGRAAAKRAYAFDTCWGMGNGSAMMALFGARYHSVWIGVALIGLAGGLEISFE